MSDRPVHAGDLLLRGRDADELLTLADVAALLPGRRRGRRMSPRVLLRWRVAGVRGVRLSTVRLGQRHLVRVGDLRAFLGAIAPGATRAAPPPSSAVIARRRARRAAVAARAAREALA